MLVGFSNETPTNILKMAVVLQNPKMTGVFCASEIKLSLGKTENYVKHGAHSVTYKNARLLFPQTFALSTHATKNVTLKKFRFFPLMIANSKK